jgi:hypothetical protein
MTDALVSALRQRGCPPETADRLAQELRTERLRGDRPPDEWTVLLHGQGHGFFVPVDADEWDAAVWSLVENVAADNAEATDRAARGEAGWTPLWPLPDRQARRS